MNQSKIPTVSEIMTKRVFALEDTAGFDEVVELLNEHRISSAPVLSNDGRVVGFVSEKDVIESLGNELFHHEVSNPDVKTLMKTKVESVSPEMDVFEVEAFFGKQNLRHAPVVDSDGKLRGMLSRRDVLRALQEFRVGVMRREGKDRAREQRSRGPMELNLTERLLSVINTL